MEFQEQALVHQLDPNRPRDPTEPPITRGERLLLTAELRTVHRDLRDKREALNSCFFELPVHAIRVNGAAITAAQIDTWIRRANAVFTSARVRLLFDASEPGPDIEDMVNDLLQSLGRSDVPEADNEARRIAGSFPDKLVIFFREPDPPPDVPCSCGGYSGGGANYIVMPGWSTRVCGAHNDTLLAHELGHYLGLGHTFVERSDGLPFHDYWRPLGGRLTSAIGAASLGRGRIDLFARGEDRGLWQLTGFVSGPSARWNETWTPRGGQLASEPLVIAHRSASTSSHGSVDEFHVFAVGSNGALWHTNGPVIGEAPHWAPWTQVIAEVDFPVAATGLQDVIHVFARHRDGRLAHGTKQSLVPTWETELLDGDLFGAPAAVVRDGFHVDVVARRSNSDDAWVRTFINGQPPSAWDTLNGDITSDPVLVRSSENLIFLFARGSDGGLWFRWRPEVGTLTAWEPWASLGGQFGFFEVWATSSLDGNIHVFKHDTDNKLQHAWGNQRGWSSWQRMTHRTLVVPALVPPYPGRVDVFDKDVNGEATQKWFEGAKWSDVDERLRQAVASGMANPSSIFDADRLFDTPPDPFIGPPWDCDPVRETMFINGTVFPIDRSNIMSYYPNPSRLSRGQVDAVKRELAARSLRGTYPQP